MYQKTELLLPENMQYNSTVKDYCDVVQEFLDSVIERQNGDVIDIGYELNAPHMTVLELSDALTHLAYPDMAEEQHTDARSALYRGMLFGLQVSNKIENITVHSFALGTYFEECDGPIMDKIVTEVGEYLWSRPALEQLISMYSASVVPHGRFEHLAEVGAGFMLMLNERAEGELYLEYASMNAAVEDLESL